jgi:hypothetical protein
VRGLGGEKEGLEGKGGGGGKGEEMTQMLYVHMNKRNFFKCSMIKNRI